MRLMAGDWQPAIALAEVSPDEPACAYAHGEEIAIYLVEGAVFATSNTCTHGQARLCDGYLEGFLIECPLHQGLFDVRNGRCAGSPVEIDVRAYDTRIVDGLIEVRPLSASETQQP